MENIFFSILVAIVLAVGLSVVVLLPSYAQARKAQTKKNDLANGAGKTLRKLTAEEVEKHQSETDCWLIVKNKVYDVTSYVNEHPGGESILNNAGGENTEGFYGSESVTKAPVYSSPLILDCIVNIQSGDSPELLWCAHAHKV